MSSLSEGCTFKECFAVVENGKLILFNNEAQYLNFEDAIRKPYKLENYRLVSHPRDVVATAVAPGGPSKFSLSGHDHLTVADAMRSDYNLKEAVIKYRFNLVPKVSAVLLFIEHLRLFDFLIFIRTTLNWRCCQLVNSWPGDPMSLISGRLL
jgi:hypothetical protein